jgi:hypothetical protein
MKKIFIFSGIFSCLLLAQGTLAQAQSLTPTTLSAELKPGESVIEHKKLFLPQDALPQRADIFFAIDITGSMGGALKEVQKGAVSMMEQIAAAIPDVRFGLISHMDYPNTYDSCGYKGTYGIATLGDYPYKLDQKLTTDQDVVTAALNALQLKSTQSGGDLPESYTRVLYELYSDPEITWRDDAKKIVIYWNDALPHSCDVALDCPSLASFSMGADPGRDGILGTADDLELEDVLGELDDRNISLITLHNGFFSNYWKCYSEKTTGGGAFELNMNGTVPDGTDLATYVASIIISQLGHINNMSLEVCTEGFESWLTSVDPSQHEDISLTVDQFFDYQIELTVPEDTAPGRYAFTVCAVGDGAKYAGQSVVIDVPDSSSIEVPLDIEPGSCPNLISLDTTTCASSCGFVDVAILGTATFDVSKIDPSTLSIVGVKPVSVTTRRGRTTTTTTSMKLGDVGTPYWPHIGKVEETDCNAEGPDGYMDLTFMLDKEELLSALENVADGDVVTLQLHGQLKEEFGGQSIIGEDVVRILKGGRVTRIR